MHANGPQVAKRKVLLRVQNYEGQTSHTLSEPLQHTPKNHPRATSRKLVYFDLQPQQPIPMSGDFTRIGQDNAFVVGDVPFISSFAGAVVAGTYSKRMPMADFV